MEGKRVEVSVILPIYNKEKYLSECLESILGQTLSDIEIICIDDGSTDGSLRVLKKYAGTDDRIIIVKQSNHGAGYSRNKGLELACGEYVQFLDADDFFELHMLEVLSEKAVKYCADVVISNADRYNNETCEFSSKNYLVMPKADREFFSYRDIEDVFSITPGVVWNKMYKRSFLQEKKIYFQNLFCCNDVAVAYLTLFEADKICCVNESLIHYRYEGNVDCITASRGEHMECTIMAFRYLRNELEKRGKYVEAKNGLQEKIINAMDYTLQFQKDKSKKIDFVKELAILLEDGYVSKAKRVAAFHLVHDDVAFWKRVEVLPDSRDYSIWGVGKNGRECYEVMRGLNLEINEVYDNNEKIHGQKIFSRIIESPNTIDYASLPLIVTSTKYENEISYQLEEEMHLIKGKDYYLFSDIRDKIGDLAVAYLGL